MTNATTKAAGRACEPAVSARALLAAMLCWAVTSGCEPQAPSPGLAGLAAQAQELGSVNGISANGISANGISANGISANGISANGILLNGLSLEALSTPDFSA